MKIKIEIYDKKIELELHDDFDLYEFMDEIQGLLAMLGYHPDSIKEYFEESENIRDGWWYKYDKQYYDHEITPEEIQCQENCRRKKPIKLATIRRQINAAGYSYK